jgi:zinc transport system permease protein
MFNFFEALVNPDISFMRYALLCGLLASVSFGIMGTYVVVRRITYLAGAISHSIFGGIGFALYAKEVWQISWLTPMTGAVLAAIGSAIIIGYASLYARQREDTIIGAIWAIGMAIGLLFIAKTPGYIDPMNYLFGNILLISQSDLWLVLGLDAVILALCYYYYPIFLSVCFDEEYSRIRGINTEFFYILLLCMTALTIVLLVRIVGIVMVIALLTIPSAVAGMFSCSLGYMMAYSVGLCMVFISSGLWASYSMDLSSGPVIIVIAGTVYLAVSFGRHLVRKKGKTSGA